MVRMGAAEKQEDERQGGVKEGQGVRTVINMPLQYNIQHNTWSE
jgi:hypothetical protein